MTAADRRRSAWHESGHGLMRYLLLGDPPELLSLRPGKAYRAITIGGRYDGWSDEFNLALPSILQPVGLRRMLEADIVISVAGDLAADMAGYGQTGYVAPTDDETATETAARALAALSPRRRELLAEAEAKPTSESDAESAAGASFALTGDHLEVVAHLGWMRVIARRLLVEHGDSLTRLAEALCAAGVMDAETFLPLARSGRCACHSWPPPKEVPVPTLPRRRTPAVYVATVTGVTELDGQDVVITAGVTRVRAGHPVLEKIPSLFEIDETGRALMEPRYSSQPAASIDPTIRLVTPVKPEDTVVATRSFIVAQGPGGMWVVQEGDRYDKRHATVKRWPDNFRPLQ